MKSVPWQKALLDKLGPAVAIASIFDHVHNAVFSIKDLEGRYVLVSPSCVERCALSHPDEAIGKTSWDLFPSAMAKRYMNQDEYLFGSGQPVIGSLDLTLYPDRSSNWCVTTKQPLRDGSGALIGLACLSMDIASPGQSDLVDDHFFTAVEYMRAHFTEEIRVEEIARIAHMPVSRFDRRMKRIFQLSPYQYILKMRIDHAIHLLACSTEPVAGIAHATGFYDQSALCRKFKATVGMTPLAYRRMARADRR